MDKPFEHLYDLLVRGESQTVGDDAVHRSCFRYLFVVARKHLNHQDAADVVEETLERELWEKVTKPDFALPARDKLRAYLSVCVHNRAVNLLKRSGRCVPLSEEDEIPAEDINLFPDGWSDPEVWAALYWAIGELRPDEKRLVMEFYFKRRRMALIAAKLNKKVGTASVQLHRTVKKTLRALVEKKLGPKIESLTNA